MKKNKILINNFFSINYHFIHFCKYKLVYEEKKFECNHYFLIFIMEFCNNKIQEILFQLIFTVYNVQVNM